MSPNSKDVEHRNGVITETQPHTAIEAKPRKLQIVWRNIFLFTVLHISALFGLFLAITEAKWATIALALWLHFFSGMGITAGAHRLWCHRAYKAKWPLRLMLMFMNCIAFQNDLHEWVRDHRVHHKYSETDADPHNAVRGFFFSHMGWLLVRKHNDVREKGKLVDMSDILADPIVRFQMKFYLPLVGIFCFFIPSVIPLLWGENIVIAFFVCGFLRYTVTLHSTWLVNSAAHIWGNKPYDKAINPSENLLAAWASCGEGWHNYHHTFPWDYATGEFGYKINVSTMFIDFFAFFGLAYDRKVVPRDIVKKRAMKFGDGTRYRDDHHHEHHH